jgi:hypothetical protein
MAGLIPSHVLDDLAVDPGPRSRGCACNTQSWLPGTGRDHDIHDREGLFSREVP